MTRTMNVNVLCACPYTLGCALLLALVGRTYCDTKVERFDAASHEDSVCIPSTCKYLVCICLPWSGRTQLSRFHIRTASGVLPTSKRIVAGSCVLAWTPPSSMRVERVEPNDFWKWLAVQRLQIKASGSVSIVAYAACIASSGCSNGQGRREGQYLESNTS